MKKVAVVGSFVVDLMARTPHLPEPGETVMGSFFKAGPGGKGANQAAAAKKAGSDLIFSTKIGRDSFAEIAKDSFESNGISLEYVFENSQAPTGAALISVEETTSQNEIAGAQYPPNLVLAGGVFPRNQGRSRGRLQYL